MFPTYRIEPHMYVSGMNSGKREVGQRRGQTQAAKVPARGRPLPGYGGVARAGPGRGGKSARGAPRRSPDPGPARPPGDHRPRSEPVRPRPVASNHEPQQQTLCEEQQRFRRTRPSKKVVSWKSARTAPTARAARAPARRWVASASSTTDAAPTIACTPSSWRCSRPSARQTATRTDRGDQEEWALGGTIPWRRMNSDQFQ